MRSRKDQDEATTAVRFDESVTDPNRPIRPTYFDCLRRRNPTVSAHTFRFAAYLFAILAISLHIVYQEVWSLALFLLSYVSFFAASFSRSKMLPLLLLFSYSLALIVKLFDFTELHPAALVLFPLLCIVEEVNALSQTLRYETVDLASQSE